MDNYNNANKMIKMRRQQNNIIGNNSNDNLNIYIKK